MKKKIKVYRTVFDRSLFKEFNFIDLLENPAKIAKAYGIEPLEYEQYCLGIKEISDKEERNLAKRNFFPACDISPSGFLSIDIDNISDQKTLKGDILKKLSDLKECFAVQESASGNLVAFFKFKCEEQDFKYVYNKIYLELSMFLKTEIDYLPEIGRLRYVSNGKLLYKNTRSRVLKEKINVEIEPKAKRAVRSKIGKRLIYKSE